MKKWAIAFTAMMLFLVSCGEAPDDETPFDFIEVEGGYAVKAKKTLNDEIKGMVNIPDTYKRKPVVEIADYAFFYTFNCCQYSEQRNENRRLCLSRM